MSKNYKNMTFKLYKSSRDAYGETLVELGNEIPRLVVLDADTSSSTRTKKFAKKFPERFFNVGVAEQNAIGIAAGLAKCRKIPFVSSFAAFIPGKCVDPIRILIAYSGLNVKIVTTHAGLTIGEDGPTQQAIDDIAIMRVMPNISVIVPADAVETKKVIKAIVEEQGPFYVRLCRPETPIILNEDSEYTIGKGVTLRDGNDVAIFACGIMVAESLIAREILKKEGVSARVINIHTIKPIDRELIVKAAKDTGAVITAEDHSVIGGLGGAVAKVLSEDYPVPVGRIGIKDTFAESGNYRELMLKYGLSYNHIAEKAKSMLKKR